MAVEYELSYLLPKPVTLGCFHARGLTVCWYIYVSFDYVFHVIILSIRASTHFQAVGHFLFLALKPCFNTGAL